MPVQLVNGHVLLPDYPAWTARVQSERRWLTAVDRALSGSESRQALRPRPRERIAFRIESRDPAELCGLLARVDAALKAGRACCPSWGRGIPLVSAVGDTVVLSRNAWAGVQGYIFLSDREAYEVGEVKAAAAGQITLAGTLARDWSAGGWVWPLVFGRPTFSDIEHRTDWHAGLTVTVSEIATPAPVSASEPEPEPLTVCFVDPWGGLESWANLASQTFTAPEGTLLDVNYVCLGPWNYAAAQMPVATHDCFADPAGGIESFGGLDNQTIDGKASGTLIPPTACLGAWGYDTNGAGTVQVSPLALPDFNQVGPTLTFELTDVVSCNRDFFPALVNWQADAWDLFGRYETWNNLAAGDPGASWTGGQGAVNPDWTPALPFSWLSAPNGPFGGYETWTNLTDGDPGAAWTGEPGAVNPDWTPTLPFAWTADPIT